MNISISLKNNNESERRTQKSLESILSKYTLGKWVLCRDIVIEQGSSGKAFPSIRLSAWIDNDEGLMAQFLHEQIHWIEKDKEEEMNDAIEELKKIFPKAPIDKPDGGGSEKSTYSHLIVCRIEFLALNEILGEEKAKSIVSGNKNYAWIRRVVIKDGSEIDGVINKYFPEIFNF